MVFFVSVERRHSCKQSYEVYLRPGRFSLLLWGMGDGNILLNLLCSVSILLGMKIQMLLSPGFYLQVLLSASARGDFHLRQPVDGTQLHVTRWSLACIPCLKFLSHFVSVATMCLSDWFINLLTLKQWAEMELLQIDAGFALIGTAGSPLFTACC